MGGAVPAVPWGTFHSRPTRSNYVEQMVQTVVGHVYSLRFMAAQRNEQRQGSVLVVKVNGGKVAEFGPNAEQKLTQPFTSFVVQLTATHSPSVLRFENASPVGDYSFLLDDVRLTSAKQ